jgi:hypothetical protein
VVATVSNRGATLKSTAGGATASVSVPPNALPVGTKASLAGVDNPATLLKKVPAGQSYVISFSVSWVAPGGTSRPASKPIALSIVDPSIRAGDTVYVLTTHGLEVVGTAHSSGRVIVLFTTDPDFVVTGVPRLSALSSKVALKGTDMQLQATCGPAARCTGTAVMRAGASATVLAKATFAIGAGKTRALSLVETVSGRRFVGSLKDGHPKGKLTIKLLGGKALTSQVALP